MPLSNEYLAGFFDGEGCINVNVSGKYARIMLRLMLTNTDLGFLREVVCEFGGRLNIRRPHKEGWKPSGTIEWSGAAAEGLLDRIGPYLRIKSRQALLARQLRDLKRDDNRLYSVIRIGSSGKPISTKFVRPEIREIEEGIKRQMHELNRRGSRDAA
jgi:hypothetical protein